MRNIIIYFILFVFGISVNLIPQKFDWAKSLSEINVNTSEVAKDVQGNNDVIGEFESNISSDTLGLVSSGFYKALMGK